MKLEEIIKGLEKDCDYWKDNPTPFTQGRMFQANKTLEQLRLYAVVWRSKQLPQAMCTLNRNTCNKGSICKYPHRHL